MKTIYKLDKYDILKIVGKTLNVPVENVQIISCGFDDGDGPGRTGSGYFIHIEVVVEETIPAQLTHSNVKGGKDLTEVNGKE